METLLKQFDSFLKRSMLPSSVLIVTLLFFFYPKVEEYLLKLSKTIVETNYFIIIIFFTVVLLIALSFIMSILTQMIFDNRIKENFNSPFIYKKESELLNKLRNKSIQKIKKESNDFSGIELNDYFLYQIIGRKLQFLKKSTSTKRYIDDIKSAGSIFLSLIISLFAKMIIDFSLIQFLISTFFIFLIYIIGREYILSKYRSRAIRIYTNYLIGEK